MHMNISDVQAKGVKIRLRLLYTEAHGTHNCKMSQSHIKFHILWVDCKGLMFLYFFPAKFSSHH